MAHSMAAITAGIDAADSFPRKTGRGRRGNHIDRIAKPISLR
jgi:hypothetical protein